MKTKLIVFVTLVISFAAGFLLQAQQPQRDIGGSIVKGGKQKIAIPDFRGAGAAQALMNDFNATLWDELQNSARLDMVAKTVYPLEIPQQPTDFKPPTIAPPLKRGEPQRTVRNGPWLSDWAGPPVSANYLVFGYAAVQDGRLVLAGWLFNVGQPDLTSAQVLGRRYFGSLDGDGAKKVAREFAADILQQFGAISLSGTKIYFVSDRSGAKEIWSMDYDGSNQKPFTSYKAVSTGQPAVSPDGKMLAFSSYLKRPGENLALPQVVVHSTETGKRMQFYNPIAPTNTTPEFTPDGRRVLFASSLGEVPMQLYIADLNGGNLQRITHTRAIEVSARVNPINGSEILFISDRSGRQQLWRMNINGTDQEMLTSGEGDVSNPAWAPNGQQIAFAWTRGYERGSFNIFVMDIAKRIPNQLTHSSDINENPWWAPDGVHLVFSSRRSGKYEIYTMLADGKNVQRLTTTGNNTQPVWAKGIN